MHASAIRITAPGKLMLMGEHAVLHGRHAVVAAVNRQVTVTLTPRADNCVTIASELGTWSGTLADLVPVAPFRFVLQAIAMTAPARGFSLTIDADFPPTVGLGSSSAVTVATVAALAVFQLGSMPDKGLLLDQSLAVIRAVQGGPGSGADAAAAIYGGALLYRAEPRAVLPLPWLPPITVRYSGGKTPTAEVIAKVEAARQAEPIVFDQLFMAMDTCSLALADALISQDLAEAGRHLNQGQRLMAAIGVSNDTLDGICAGLCQAPGITGAKISGSGLGDCIVAFGTTAAPAVLPGEPVDVSLCAQGVTLI